MFLKIRLSSFLQDKSPKKKVDESHPQLLTTRREALSLYREIMRITALFDWPNETGRLWYVVEVNFIV
jgi:hypothetical protein